ncbi:MAG: hypothetical protein GTN40_00170 [Candidatus Aenigmarchaeota archaeon]|nr:hypothetical protein [Candidatus Aenigmarchaeota archaeon]
MTKKLLLKLVLIVLVVTVVQTAMSYFFYTKKQAYIREQDQERLKQEEKERKIRESVKRNISVRGVVSKVDGNSLQTKLKEGQVVIYAVDSKTVYQKGSSSENGSLSDVKVGSEIVMLVDENDKVLALHYD